MNYRIDNLLDLAGISSSRIIKEVEDEFNEESINWDNTKRLINQKKNESLLYLKNALKNN